MHLGSAKEDPFPALFSFKIGEPGIRRVIYMDSSFLNLDRVYIFLSVENGSFKAYWVKFVSQA